MSKAKLNNNGEKDFHLEIEVVEVISGVEPVSRIKARWKICLKILKRYLEAEWVVDNPAKAKI